MKCLQLPLPVRKTPVFIIADVHANLPALVAVLNSIPAGADILCAGDLLGYYTEPNEVCRLLIERKVHCIKGNHDKYVLGELEYPQSRESKYRIQQTRDALHLENLEWVASLPDAIDVTFTLNPDDGPQTICRLKIAHGSPNNAEEYIYKNTDIEFSWPDQTEYLVLGHTHHPMQRALDSGIIINPGSVGQARDRIPGACYAAFNPAVKKVEFFRAKYDIESYQKKLRDHCIQDAMIEILSRTS
ncbi:metallophosphoesterase family protein [Pseudomonas sp. NPDC087598]|uniref:metallophosphoesterase family protein n=1 Tax=Pseudomonas sp. NPDC087598 TaxID=3364440 RepID=UPI00381C2177